MSHLDSLGFKRKEDDGDMRNTALLVLALLMGCSQTLHISRYHVTATKKNRGDEAIQCDVLVYGITSRGDWRPKRARIIVQPGESVNTVVRGKLGKDDHFIDGVWGITCKPYVPFPRNTP